MVYCRDSIFNLTNSYIAGLSHNIVAWSNDFYYFQTDSSVVLFVQVFKRSIGKLYYTVDTRESLKNRHGTFAARMIHNHLKALKPVLKTLNKSQTVSTLSKKMSIIWTVQSQR